MTIKQELANLYIIRKELTTPQNCLEDFYKKYNNLIDQEQKFKTNTGSQCLKFLSELGKESRELKLSIKKANRELDFTRVSILHQHLNLLKAKIRKTRFMIQVSCTADY